MRRLVPTLFLGLTALLMGACSTSMGGHVFLDANNNKEVDGGEKGVQGVHFTVTRDGKKVGEGYTDAMGGYVVKVKEPGKYCVNLDKVSLQGQDLKYKPSPSVSPLIEVPTSVPSPAPKPESPPPPLKTPSMAKYLPGQEPAPPSPPPPPTDSYAKPAAAAPAGPAEGTVTLSAMSGCVQMGMSSQDVDLPIVPDYSSTIQSLLTPSSKSLGVGENFDYKVIWPASCRLVSSAIPDIFISTGDVGILSDVSPMLDFSEPVVADSVSQTKDLTQDGLASKVIKLQVRGNVSGEKTQHTLQPKVLCPDGTTYTLPGQAITIVSKSMVSVSQAFVDKYNYVPGETETNEITIENNTQQPVVGANLTVSSTKNILKLSSSDPDHCKPSGVDIACTFDLLPGKTTVKVTYVLPKINNKDNTDEEYFIDASLKIPSQTEAISGNRLHFYLSPTQ